ncbi:MAG: hypothetical protein JRH16_11890 [Deltaproteobacteria bacterium]|nr:hypothetical protein [Deltaproteobacteria bacterium]MBW2361056.1 hypothetical protein [Deltaproteobacteria bacterium]
MSWLSLRRALGLGTLLCLISVAPAHADSALRLDWPGTFGVRPAVTYDTERHRVGDAEVRIEKLPDGNLSLSSVSGFTGADRTLMRALLEPVDGGRHLRPVWQESRSFDADERALGRLHIDHREGVARCFTADGEKRAELTLPAEDRVANVTLSLLFLPLVRGDAEELSFDLFFCGLGFRFITFSANLATESQNGSPQHALEVRYGPDLGIASFVANALVPKLSVWFTPEQPHAWLAHRLPLYGGGPEVLVVRKGVPPRWLGDD